MGVIDRGIRGLQIAWIVDSKKWLIFIFFAIFIFMDSMAYLTFLFI